MSGSVDRRWDKEPEPVERTQPLLSRRLWLLLSGGTATVVLLGIFIGLVRWLEGKPSPHFVPIFVADYRSMLIPDNSAARRDWLAIRQGQYFSNVEASTLATEQGHLILAELNNLTNRDADESVVVYLAAYAALNQEGKIFLMPGNVRPDDPATVVLLHDVLEELKRCPSTKKLLVLEICWDLAEPRLGLLGNDVASAIELELQDAEDPHLTVLTSCSPGQNGLVSEELGRSLFNYHFELALRGEADGYNPKQERDARVSVFELARYLEARVDRWAWNLFQERQTPRWLRRGKDFDLIALAHDRHTGEPNPSKDKEYPKWLADAWALHDQWVAEQVYRLDPPMFRKLEVVLLRAESEWGMGVETAQFQSVLRLELAQLKQRVNRAKTTLPNPSPRSLAQAEALGYKPTTDIHVEVLELLVQVEKQVASAKPTEVAGVKKKLIDALLAKTKTVADEDFIYGVFTAAVQDPDLDLTRIGLLEELLLTRRAQARYVETLWIQRLASAKSLPWSPAMIRTSLQVVAKGEQAMSRSSVFAWLKPMLEPAIQARHNAEVLFWSAGYIPTDAMSQQMVQANEMLDKVLAMQHVLVRAKLLLNEAFVFLPAHVPYMMTHPLTESTWQNALHASSELASILMVEVPTDLEQNLSEIERKSVALEQYLQSLRRPFSDRELAVWLDTSQAQTRARHYFELGTVLSCPFLDIATRKKVWLAQRKLGRKLRAHAHQLDVEDDRSGQLTRKMDPASIETARQLRREEQLLLARSSLGLLQLAGMPEKTLQPTSEALTKGDLLALGPALWEVWVEGLPQTLSKTTSLRKQDRLSRLLLPLEDVSSLPLEGLDATVRVRANQVQALIAWIVDRYRYEVYEGQSVTFYSEAVREYAAKVGPQPHFYVSFTPPSAVTLSRAQPKTEFGLSWSLQGAVPDKAKSAAEVFNPAPTQLVLKREADSNDTSLSLDIAWRTELGGTNPPEGFLVRVDVAGKSFHQPVPFASLPNEEPVELLLGQTPASLSTWTSALRLRPLAAFQPYYLGLRNKTAKQQTLIVDLPGSAPQKVTLVPMQTMPVVWTGTAPKPGTALPELKGPLTVRILDATTMRVLLERELDVEIAHPREYVQITQAQFVPKNLAQNQLTVQLQAKQLLTPACTAELSLLPTLIPGLLSVKSGNLRGVIPADGKKPLMLQALNLQLAPSVDEEGLVPITIDDCKRAFVLQVPFARSGDVALQARLQRQPTLRLDAPKLAKTGAPFSVGVEADEAPQGAKLQVSYGRGIGSSYQPERVYKYPSARQRRVGFALGPNGAMSFQASIQDWQVAIDTKGLLGRRMLRAQLLTAEGRVLRTATKAWTLDANPPEEVLFVQTKVDAKKTSVAVQASSDDPLSGIAKAVFWIGAPVDGKLPPSTPTVAGTATDASQTTWSADLPLPAMAKGKIDVSVQFTNGVGLTRIGTTTIDLDPAPTTPKGPTTGTITGTILEGPRPQPKLPVVLLNAQGGQVDKTMTATDGSFTFLKVKPGAYKVQSVKMTSMRKGVTPVTVEAGKTAKVTVNLTF